MKAVRAKRTTVVRFICVSCFLCLSKTDVFAVESWQLVVNGILQKDAAVGLAIADLQTTGEAYGLSFRVVSEETVLPGNTILIGNGDRNTLTADYVRRKKITLQSLDDEQGFEIRSFPWQNDRLLVVAGGSIIGDVYGLYWLRDRIRVFKDLPEINTLRIPALKTRISLAWGRSPSGGGVPPPFRHRARTPCRGRCVMTRTCN